MVRRVEERGFFVERRHAETDAELKQTIPYCVLTRGDEVFLVRRLAAGGEVRLHGKRSIGIGGHVNPPDTAGSGVVDGALHRELAEEIEIDGGWSATPVGLLNDDSTDVGSVHFGLVHRVAVEGEVRVRETDRMEGSFVPVAELSALCARERQTFETWSALIVDQIHELLAGECPRVTSAAPAAPRRVAAV